MSYSNQYIRQSLSRSAAEDLFSKIVLSAKDWEPVSQGISSLTESGMIEESELEKTLLAFCRSKLADVKCPRSIDFRPELPRHPTGKLYKRLLKDEYWKAAGRNI